MRADETEDRLARALAAIVHRGPDAEGRWHSLADGVALGHRRLSILDLSAAGHQPMASPGGRYVVAFNGEIYNHARLRADLAPAGGWRGHSDTETLLAGFEAWGLEATLQRAVGMFALAIWDSHEKTITLARDRLGEKPLYYGRCGDTWLFGSDLAALRTHPACQAEIDRQALAALLRYAYVPAPASIYTGLAKLPPGTWVTLRLEAASAHPVAYWSAASAVAAGLAQPLPDTPAAAIKGLDALLREAVAGQMLSDVPLGAFLSGGVDSSTVVALMQAQGTAPVRTFTIGFHEDHYNEAEHAAAVARHLGTDHTEWYVTAQEAQAVIPQLPSLYSEPFADSSQIPTHLVSRLARQHVTVALSGDAGDELFGGYNRYVIGQRLWGRLSRLPVALRAAAGAGIRRVSPARWNQWLGPVQRLLPAHLAAAGVGDKLHKGAHVMAARTATDLYAKLVSIWQAPEAVVLGLTGPVPSPAGFHTGHFVQDMMATDLITYLPDDILCKVDRAAMGVSLETRVPFLDHRVVEYAWRMPLALKLRDGVGKWALRQVLYRYVPPALIERPKMGFGVPIDSWLRGPLREWAETLLEPARLRQEGYFNPAPIRARWEAHLSGRVNAQHELWCILMFQAWLEQQRSSTRGV